MYFVDYHTHPYSHGEVTNYNKRLYKKYIDRAISLGINEIGFSDHDDFEDEIDLSIIDLFKDNSNIKVLKGLEIEYKPGREEEIREKINKYKLDYSIGSVHFIDDWPFDHPDYINEYKNKDIYQCYVKYFDILNSAVKSELFNIVGHFDLIKVFNYKPNQNIIEIVEPVLRNIKKYNLVIEINTNGLNKPVGEVYPARSIIDKAFQLKIPITFGSDAHRVERVGENIKEVTKIVKDIGYKEIAVFREGELLLKPI